MNPLKVFIHDDVRVNYKYRQAIGDRRHLVVIFSGFRKLGTFDFDGGVVAGLRGDILWIQDHFYDNYAYYLCQGMDYSIRDSVYALIEETRIGLGLEKSQCTMAGFSKGGSAALYFGIKYNYGAVVSTVPQMHIGSYVYKNWPIAFEAMTGNGSAAERVKLDRVLPDLIRGDTEVDRNIYLFSSEADEQFPHEVEPYLDLFSKYSNFNFILTDSPLVTEHHLVTRYNVPLILSIISALIEGVAPRLGEVRNGSRNHRSSLAGPSIVDVQNRKELLSGLTAAPIRDGRLYFEGYGFIKGFQASRYKDIEWQVHFISSAGKRFSYYAGGIRDVSLNNRFYENEPCDYSIASFASMGRKGVDLEELPDGVYRTQLEVTHAGTTVEDKLASSKGVEIWGVTSSSIVGIHASTTDTTLIKRPAVGPEPRDGYFCETKRWIKNSLFHVEGYFAVRGLETPRYADVAYYLVFTSLEDAASNRVIKIAAAHRDDVGERLGDPWGDYSKSYFATPRYQGVDLASLDPGTYAVHITVRMGKAVFSQLLESGVVVQGTYSNGDPILSVGVIGSCISRDNFASAVVPNWKKYFAFHGGQYQMAFVSLMAEPASLPGTGFDDLDPHSKGATVRDFTKAYLSELVGGGPPIIVLDFLADARYGCLKFDGTLVTNNKWKLQESAFFKGLEAPDIVSMDNNEEHYLELFRNAARKFEEFRAAHLPDTQIVINSARAVGWHIDGNKKVSYSAAYIRSLNLRLDTLEKVYLEEAPATVVLDDLMTGIASSKNHPWGPGQVHYESDFYQRFQDALKAITGYGVQVSVK